MSKRVIGISNNGNIIEEVDNKKLYGISPWSLDTQYFEGDKITFNDIIYELQKVRDHCNMTESLQFVAISESGFLTEV